MTEPDIRPITVPVFYGGRSVHFSSFELIIPKTLSEIVEVNNVVFNGSRSPEQISQKLSSYGHQHFTTARCTDPEYRGFGRNNLVGYGMGYEEHDKYYLWMLGVLPNFRSDGIGSEILHEQIDFARESRYQTFFLKTSNKWRDMLRLLLTSRFGFDITGFKANEWGTDSAIWLEKNLTQR